LPPKPLRAGPASRREPSRSPPPMSSGDLRTSLEEVRPSFATLTSAPA
jgi:hypothetical protein